MSRPEVRTEPEPESTLSGSQVALLLQLILVIRSELSDRNYIERSGRCYAIVLVKCSNNVLIMFHSEIYLAATAIIYL